VQGRLSLITTRPDRRLLAFVAENRWGVLVTRKRDGRPQVSNVGYFYDPESQLFGISVTADRAKTRNVARDPRATLHVPSKDFWTWAAVDPGVPQLRRVMGHGRGRRC
jgi:PPOX class probable F420-dependent enzyme